MKKVLACLLVLVLSPTASAQVFNIFVRTSGGTMTGPLVVGNSTLSTTGLTLSSGSGTISTIFTAQSIGTVTNNTFYIRTNNTERWQVTLANLLPVTDNASDLGLSTNRVRSLYTSGGYTAGITTKTANYTATANDFTIIVDATAGAVTITLPAASSNAGRIYNIKKIDASANSVTIDPNGAELIDGAATFGNTTQYRNFQIQCDGTGWHVLGRYL
jgi:hypothetical protein